MLETAASMKLDPAGNNLQGMNILGAFACCQPIGAEAVAANVHTAKQVRRQPAADPNLFNFLSQRQSPHVKTWHREPEQADAKAKADEAARLLQEAQEHYDSLAALAAEAELAHAELRTHRAAASYGAHRTAGQADSDNAYASSESGQSGSSNNLRRFEAPSYPESPRPRAPSQTSSHGSPQFARMHSNTSYDVPRVMHRGPQMPSRHRAASPAPTSDSGRRIIMDLHKQAFGQEIGPARANMATPVELPGDKVRNPLSSSHPAPVALARLASCPHVLLPSFILLALATNPCTCRRLR